MIWKERAEIDFACSSCGCALKSWASCWSCRACELCVCSACLNAYAEPDAHRHALTTGPVAADAPPLIAAVTAGDVAACQRLLAEPGADACQAGADGNTALHLAAAHGRADICALLIRHGASVDAVNAAGDVPLHLAVHAGAVPVVRLLLLQGANVDAADKLAATPLHVAIRAGNVSAARVLLEQRASATAVASGLEPLRMAGLASVGALGSSLGLSRKVGIVALIACGWLPGFTPY